MNTGVDREICQRIGVCATLSVLWEVAAPKVGNVHRSADFADASFVDFATAAAVVGPLLGETATRGVGNTVRSAAQATLEAVGTNTNLGTLLLLAPLAAAASECAQHPQQLAASTGDVLDRLTEDDTAGIYAAVDLLRPGGLGHSAVADVADGPPRLRPLEVMRLASERDTIARQYTCQFEDVFQRAAPALKRGWQDGETMSQAIVRAQLRMLAELPDSHIARQSGQQVAAAVSARAAKVLDVAHRDKEQYQRELADFDFWLRSAGSRRNPGTTADLIAAGLFVLLWRGEVDWPLDFYGLRSQQEWPAP